ncbi:SDR family oxidoreductase [Actinomadura sp. 7K507]|uniref:SDR family NAD(P)-dependent oxidoreductase n=1 Tax=Actinomadura sp. 7K507 TaxID=2530365 RepID=UPI001050F147|nr:SDR family oxidoreductase [Actinomadura sp. 7K507]TDC97597.1 SDR family oxidoreductase [Actinomadura sp. 7K507]
MNRPENRTALVTGGSAGIGAETCRLLAERGHDVWLTYASDAGGAERTADACRERGVRAVVSPLDQRDTHAIERLTDRIAAEWGHLDVLVNNAGTCPYTDWDAITGDEWDTVMETNARGAFFLMRHAVPLLGAAGGGASIVNVASLAGQIGGLSTSAHYAASKAAVLALTRSFARRLAPEGIRVNAVAPGPIGTGLIAPLDASARDALAASVPLGRLGRAHDVAHTIVLLASADAAFTTGATYDVNGGLRMD